MKNKIECRNLRVLNPNRSVRFNTQIAQKNALRSSASSVLTINVWIKKTLRSLFLTVFLCGSFSAFSQTVESYIELANQNNHSLKALRLEYEAAQFVAAQHQDFPDPKVSLGLAILPVETRLGAQRFKIGVSQSIPWKGQLNARSNVAIAAAEVISNLDEVKFVDIEYAIRTVYSLLVLINEKENILNQKLEVLNELEEIVKIGVVSGKSKLSNVLFVKRSKDLLLADIDLLNKQREQPTILINRWAGKPLDEPINIDINNNILLNMQAAILMPVLTTDHPQFQVLKNQKSASNKAIELTKFEAKPKIGVGVDYSWIDGTNNVEIPHNGRDVLMPMASISIPLSKGRFRAKRQEEKVRQEAIDSKIMDLEIMYLAEIKVAKSKIEYADMTIKKYDLLKTTTENTLQIMKSEYAADGTRFEELLSLEMDIIDYDLAIAQAQYEMSLAIATIYKFKD